MRKTYPGRAGLAFNKVALLVLSCLLPATAGAGPEGARVAHGSVQFSQNGNYTTIHASDRAIINYQKFDIARPETVEFIQPSSMASVLNRILSASPTRIDGTLLANGRVFFVNPAGVIFGPTAQVNVPQLVASALDISNIDFINGNYVFAGGSGDVVNQGVIRSQKACLIAKQVVNSGHIDCPGGYVILASGDRVFLGEPGSDVLVEVGVQTQPAPRDASPERAAVTNEGAICVGGGRVVLAAAGDIYSQAIVNRGTLSASTAVGDAGSVELRGTEGTVINSGSIEARSATGTGGTVKILGDRVGLIDEARVDASGAAGGGTVLVGGDYQGRGDTPTASRTFVGPDAVIEADATENGDGGKIVVWSEERTGFYGSVSARGGVEGGDGGFAEVSGNTLVYRGHSDLGAPLGDAGTLLLDPTVITIAGGTAGGDDDTDNGNPDSDYLNDSSGGEGWVGGSADPAAFTVYESEIENTDAHIILEAHDGINTSGDFSNDDLVVMNDRNLTLRTRNDALDAPTGIDLTSSVEGAGLEIKTQGVGSITIETGVLGAVAPQAAPINLCKLTADGSGGIGVNATGTLTAGGAIGTSGGSVFLSSQDGLAVNGGITAGVGGVTLEANQDGAGAEGFSQADGTTISGTNIGIRVNTPAGTGTGGAQVSTLTDAGALTITTDNVAHDAGGSITRTGTSVLSGTSVSLTTGTGDIGASGTALNLAANQTGVAATTHGAGRIYLRGPGALTLGAITTAGGLADIATTAAGSLTAGGAIGTSGGSVFLSSQDGLAVNGGITAGVGGVTLEANQDGAGAEGFSQADGTTISGTNIGIRVNTPAGTGTGGAQVSTLTDAGALTITTDNVAHDAGGSITRTGTSVLSGTSVSLTTGTGDIGASGTALNLAANQTGVAATTHGAGRIYLRAPGALTLGAITTAGGLVDIATTAAGTLTAGGAIGTSGGSVALSSQDGLAVNGGITAGGVTITNGGLLKIGVDADMDLDGPFLQNGAGAVETAGDITTTGDGITFQGAVTLTAGTGNIDFDGAVGGTTDLGNVVVQSATDVTINASFNADDITITASDSTIDINGDVTAHGSLVLNNNTTVAADRTLKAGNELQMGAGKTLTAKGNLSLVATNGVITEDGVVGVFQMAMPAGGGTLMLTQSDALNMNTFNVANAGSTDLVATSTGPAGSITDTAADQWHSITATAETGITLGGTNDIGTNALTSSTGNIAVRSTTGDLVVNGPINANRDAPAPGGGVSLISDGGKVYTPDADGALNVAITGYSDHATGHGVDLDTTGAIEGKAAIVIDSYEPLKLGSEAVLIANGKYDASELPEGDDRKPIGLRYEGVAAGDAIDVAIYLAARSRELAPADRGDVVLNAGEIDIAYLPEQPDQIGALVVDAYHTVGFGDAFRGSLPTGTSELHRIEVVSRISDTLDEAERRGALPYAHNPQSAATDLWGGLEDRTYVLRGEQFTVGVDAYELGRAENAPLPPISYAPDIEDRTPPPRRRDPVAEVERDFPGLLRLPIPASHVAASDVGLQKTAEDIQKAVEGLRAHEQAAMKALGELEGLWRDLPLSLWDESTIAKAVGRLEEAARNNPALQTWMTRASDLAWTAKARCGHSVDWVLTFMGRNFYGQADLFRAVDVMNAYLRMTLESPPRRGTGRA